MPSGGAERTAAVAILVRDPRRAKSRLAPGLGPADRARLARAMFEDVLDASAAAVGVARVIVVSDSRELRSVARSRGATAIHAPARGTTAAARVALAHLGRSDLDVVILHADLPLATAADVAALARSVGIVIVPDRHGAGTNALRIPAGSTLRPRFGARSLERHRAAAREAGERWRVGGPRRLRSDVDTVADLRALRRTRGRAGRATRAFFDGHEGG